MVWRKLLAVAMVVLAGSVALPQLTPTEWLPSAAASVVLKTDALVPARHGHFAFVHDGELHVLGGRLENGQIVATVTVVDLSTLTSRKTSSLPFAVHGAAGVWTGQFAYLFGGQRSSGLSNAILRYDPATETTQNLGGLLPRADYRWSAVWTGERALILGGSQCGFYCNTILRFDPATPVVQNTGHTLPQRTAHAVAAYWDGAVFLFGGTGSPVGPTFAEIVRYDVGSGSSQILTQSLPYPVWMPSIAVAGARAYIVGGSTDTTVAGTETADVVMYDMATGQVMVTVQPADLRRFIAASVFHGDDLLSIGGSRGGYAGAPVTALGDLVRHEYPAQFNLAAFLSPYDLEVELVWNPRPTGPDHLEIWTASDGSPAILAAVLPPDAERHVLLAAPSCQHLAWGQGVTFQIKEIQAGGLNAAAAFERVVPCSRTHLLDVLVENYEFYWGPASFENDNGPPGVDAPTALVHFGEYPGRLAQWFAMHPVAMACCDPLLFDANALRPDADEFSFSPSGWLGGALTWVDPIEDLLEELMELATVRGTFTGVAFEDAPFLDPHNHDYATVLRESGLFAEAQVLGVGFASDGVTTSGTLFLDEAAPSLDTGGLAEVSLTIPLPTIEFDMDGPDKDFKKFGIRFETESELFAELDPTPSVVARLGSSPARPTLVSLAGTLETEAAIIGSIEAGTRRCEVEGSLTGRIGLGVATEHVIGFAGAPPTYYSSALQVRFDEPGAYVGVLKVGPATSEVDAEIELDCGWFEPNLSLSDIPALRNIFDFPHIPPVILAFGAATVHVDEGTLIDLSRRELHTLEQGPAATSVQSLSFAPDVEHAVFEVQGEPGSDIRISLQRPVAFLLSNGSAVVTPLRTEIPAARIGEDGAATFHWNIAEMNRAAFLASRHGLSEEASKTAGRAAIDLDGDGTSDVAVGQVKDDPRSPTEIWIEIRAGAGIPAFAYQGEPIEIHVQVKSPLGLPSFGPPSPDDKVRVTSTSGLDVSIPLGLDGRGFWNGFHPGGSIDGDHDALASFPGSDGWRGATRSLQLMVKDRAPLFEVETPIAFQVVNRTTGHMLIVQGSLGPATDLGLWPMSAWIDNHPPVAPNVDGLDFVTFFDLGPGGLAATEGLHHVTLRSVDQAGLARDETIPFVVDMHPPEVEVEDDTAFHFEGDDHKVEWSSNEPVSARLFWERRSLESGGAVVDSGVLEAKVPALSGELTIEGVKPGFYNHRLEIRDLGGSYAAPEVMSDRAFVVVLHPGDLRP